MKIFSSHQRKLEPHRRFGSLEFRSKIRDAANHKRVFEMNRSGWSLSKVTWNWRFWRNFGIVLALVIIYFTTMSPYFKIERISVSGNQQVSSQAIEDAIKASGNPRLFFLGRGRVENILTSHLPAIKEITEFDRAWPNKMTLTVSERNPGFVIESHGNYFLIDDQGVVVSQIDQPNDYLVIQDQAMESFATNEALPNQKLAPFVLSMSRQWTGKVSSAVTGIKLANKNSTDVQFETAEGWSVLFDTSRAVNIQLSNLSLLLNRQITAQNRADLAYIDLRLNKFAYYCFKASPCSSTQLAEGAESNEQQ